MQITELDVKLLFRQYANVIDQEFVTLIPRPTCDSNIVIDGLRDAKEPFTIWPAFVPKRIEWRNIAGIDLPIPVRFQQYLENRRYQKLQHWRRRKTVGGLTIIQTIPTRDNIKTFFEEFMGASVTAGALDIINEIVAEEKKYDAIAPRLFALRKSGYGVVNEGFVGWSNDFTPFKHQSVIVEFLRHLDAFANLSQMGVGKTYIEIASAVDKLHNHEIDKVLVVCPKNLIYSVWHEQTNKFSNLTISVIEGTAKKKRDAIRKHAQMYIIGFDSLWRPGINQYIEELVDDRTLVILDEATKIKTHSAKRSKAVHRLGRLTQNKHILTGTPVTQSVKDVFSLWLFLDCGRTFGVSFQAFMDEYFTANQHVQGHKVKSWAPERISDMIFKQSIRYTKDEVMKDLPPKMYQRIDCVMGEQQERMYNMMKEEFIAIFDSGEPVKARAAIAQLTRLSQITAGFLPISDGSKNPEKYMEDACKPSVCLELVQEAVSSGHSVVIWCRYKAEIRYLKWLLTKNDIRNVQYYSQVKEKGEGGRIEAVNHFQAGDVPVFIGQPQSGGLGLDLWKGSIEIWYGHIYSYADRIQAEDRCHREGSQIHDSIQIIDLCAKYQNGKETIDHWILNLIQQKKSVADVVTRDVDTMLSSI